MVLTDYIRLVRPTYHVTYIEVVLGALLFAGQITESLPKSLALLYLSFNLLLYGGIYTLNDVVDASSDAKHQLKRNRPIPSGRIGRKKASMLAVTLITAGLLSGFLLFSKSIFSIYIATLALNLLYTFAAKKVPYLELVVNSATHPIRFAMGVLLVNSMLPYTFLIAIFSLAFGFACVRRSVEKDVKGWEARQTLRYYNGNMLFFLKVASFILILLLAVIDNSTPKALHLIIIATYLTLVFGTDLFPQIRNLFRGIWTK